MPKIPAERLIEIGQALFEAAGTPPAEAELVMRHIISANLVGHDSHGVIQIPTYIDRIKAGHIVPGAPGRSCRNCRRRPSSTGIGGLAMSPTSGRCG